MPYYIAPVSKAYTGVWGKYASGGYHPAVDYAVVTGTPFRMAMNGVVKIAGWSNSGYGKHIRVLMDDGNTVIYGHLSEIGVTVGQRVTAGQIMGKTGNTGNSTGPHLHMEVRRIYNDQSTAWNFTPYLHPYTVVVPVTKEWWEMAIPDAEIERIASAVWSRLVDNPVTGEWAAETGLWSSNKYAMDAARNASTALGEVRALRAALDAFIKAHGEQLPPPDPEPVPVDPDFSLGWDMSGHQTVAQVVEATKLTDFGIVKITEGYGFENAVENEQVAAVRLANDLVGMYHFAWPSHDPIQELEHFLTEAELRVGELPSLDIENWDQKNNYADMVNADWPKRVDYALKWLEGCEARTGALAPWYVNWTWLKGLRSAATIPQWERLCRFPVWIAQPVKNLTSLGTKGKYGTDWRWREPGEFDQPAPKEGSTVAPYVMLHQYRTSPHDMNWLDGGKLNWAKHAVKR